ncbi:hypothetical protein ACI1MP_27145 [Kitasatospora griseola]|uniref:hypothetical protein n=1 Tax=Kitasatospora griseola TaxID=2064 RepID=UPI003855D4C8
MLQRILSGWHGLAKDLHRLEEHLAEHTDYVVQVDHTGLPQSVHRIAKYLAEEHPQPAVAIGHLHDWLKDIGGAQLRCDWVALLAGAQEARGLTVSQRADFVVIAEVLCFPPQPAQRTTESDRCILASQALTSGSTNLLLVQLDQAEPELAQLARREVERSRSPLTYGRSPRRWTVLAVAVALLATAGVVTAVMLPPDGPPPLPGREVAWFPSTLEPGDGSYATVNVPPEAHRLVAHIQLTDEQPDLGSCPNIHITLAAEPGGATDWQTPDQPLSVAVPPGHTGLRITLRLNASDNCKRRIDTQRVEFER